MRGAKLGIYQNLVKENVAKYNCSSGMRSEAAGALGVRDRQKRVRHVL